MGDSLDVTIPHFDLPFRFGPDGHVAVVQQSSEEDVLNCVQTVVRTPLGFRSYVPEFGIDDPTFKNDPLDLVTLESQISKNEPRAILELDQTVDSADELITRLTIGVNQ